MKTISERGRDRPAQDEMTNDIEIDMKVVVCNQVSMFTKYNGQVGIVEEIGNCPCVNIHGCILFSIRLSNDRVLLLYRDEIEILKEEEQ